MPNKPIQTSSLNSGGFNNKLNKDVVRFGKNPNDFAHARNAINNSVVGDIGDISNEAANYLCQNAPYTIIGVIFIEKDEWVILSTDNTNCEIGLFKEDSCYYEKIVNSQLLNFNTDNLIKGIGRTAYNCGRRIYWDDGINPTRMLDIDNIPWVQNCTTKDCKECVDTDVLDIDKLRLTPIIQDLAFHIQRGSSAGQIINGSYYVFGAYLIEGERVTDYSLPSNVQPIFDHTNASGSLDIFIDEADEEFDEFELIIVQFANGNTSAKKVGVYSTRQNKITLDTIDQRWVDIDPSLILVQNAVVDKSEAIYRNGDYAIRVGPTNKLNFNYQPLANQIEAQWVSVEYSTDYYRKGGSNTGFMRDEVYSFFIRWVWNTGDKTASYHIPGRAATTSDLSRIGSAFDVLEGDDPVTWKTYNTATREVFVPSAEGVDDTGDGGRIIGRGKMGYWESTEKYIDDKPQIWNASSQPYWKSNNKPEYDLCGKNIRHHRFPDNGLMDSSKSLNTSSRYPVNHFDPIDGTKIRILGVEFFNIKPPLDNEGKPISNIVGYEILRGSREGNKTILAKGMINNMRQYTTDDNTGKQYLYPNYPYNATEGYSLGVDKFLSSTPTSYQKNAGSGKIPRNSYGAHIEQITDNPLGILSDIQFPNVQHIVGNIRTDMFTFHSPETNFRNPFLSAKELKIYGELKGEMIGKFQLPKDHPRHKFINNTAFMVSAIMGLGYASVKTRGVTTRTHKAPDIDYGGTKTDVATGGTTGMVGASAGPSVLQSGNVGISQSLNAVMDNMMGGVIGLLTSVTGINPYDISQTARTVSGLVTGSIGGRGGRDDYTNTDTEWGAIPGVLRTIQGVPMFLSFWAEGLNKMLEVIYAFVGYKHHAIQQISHGFYNQFTGTDSGNMRRSIKEQTYLNPSLQDFATDYRINNIYRSRTIALNTNLGLDLLDDKSQVLLTEERKDYDDSDWRDDAFDKNFTRPIASYYTALKQRLDNQYGQIAGIVQIPMTTSYIEKTEKRSRVLFGGDTYIGRYTEKNTMFFFYDWLKGQPDGHSFNYNLRKMLPHPRFWMDTDPYDVSEFFDSFGKLFGDKVHQSFDPFAIDTKYTQEFTYDENGKLKDTSELEYINTSPGGVYNPKLEPICACELPDNTVYSYKYQHCAIVNYANTQDLTDLCAKQKELNHDIAFREWIEAVACFFNQVDENTAGVNDDNACSGCNCNEDYSGVCHPETLDNFFTDIDFIKDNCPECAVTDGGAKAYGYSNWNNKQLSRWHCKGAGKIKRNINKADRKIRRSQRKYDKVLRKIYDKYIAEITKDGGKSNKWKNFFRELDTPNDKYSFDMREQNKFFKMGVKDAYMYLFNSGVRDFFVESEINIDLRDWGEQPEQRHYDHIEYSNLPELFSTDHIKTGNYMKYDYSLSISKALNSFTNWGIVQDREYDPFVAETCYVNRPKRLMYSLPQGLENKKDNWRVFLPLNYKDFSSPATAIKPISKNGAIILFEHESPIMFQGTQELTLNGDNKITIGDGKLFEQPLISLVNSEYANEYGSCQNRLGVANTPAGLYFMSQNQGKIFMVSNKGLTEISNIGLKWWFAKYLPYQLTKHPTAFKNTNGIDKDFDLDDNPVTGIGCQVVYDNFNQLVYFCKKDWKIRTDIADTVTYLSGNKFLINNLLTVSLGDPRYFLPASWTISWDPKTNGWLSYHDWHPDLTIPTKKTFITTKDEGLWVHADRCDLYCNFYGIDYPFELEYSLHTNANINILRSISYLMEAYVYNENCYDRFHVLDANFDEAVVYNSEQCSGLLKLNLMPKNNAPLINHYPLLNPNSIDILFAKEEQRYRFNQFWDITADRGEFNDLAQRSIFLTEPNGYIKNLNPANLNYNKNALERKKFRHYKHTVLLRKKISGNKNFVVSLNIQMNINSPR